MTNRLDELAAAIGQLQAAAAKEGMKIEKIMVDKTLDLKYELTTGLSIDDPKIACDPFTSFVVAGVTIVGRDNEWLRNHKEWE
jgi:hypothetical protein